MMVWAPERMDGWLRQIALNAQIRAGLSADTMIWAAVAAIASTVALVFLLIASFIWLSDRYGTVIAGLDLGTLFLAIAVIAIVACVVARRRNIENARIEQLELRKSANTNVLDPRLMAVGLPGGRTRASRRVAAVGLLAADLALEWIGYRQRVAEREGSVRNAARSGMRRIMAAR